MLKAMPTTALLEITGHRGALGLFPGNSLAGFAHALESGVHAVELDVWVTGDDELVLFHDGVVPTASGPMDIRKTNLRDVAISRRGQTGFTEEDRAPTLHELLALFRLSGASDVIIDVEVKPSKDTDRRYLDRATERVAAVLLAHADEQAMRVRSFDMRVLERFAELAPTLGRIGLIAHGWGQNLAAMIPGPVEEALAVARSLELFALAPQSPWVTPQWVDGAHAAGREVLAWGGATLEDELDTLLDAGCDGMCVDDPGKLRGMLLDRGLAVPPTRGVRLPLTV
jgi:glycerophosphoryl diester phosphodiesterase